MLSAICYHLLSTWMSIQMRTFVICWWSRTEIAVCFGSAYRRIGRQYRVQSELAACCEPRKLRSRTICQALSTCAWLEICNDERWQISLCNHATSDITMTTVKHARQILRSLPSKLTLWGNKNWTPQYESEKVKNILGQKWLKWFQMVQFECPRHPIPSV